MQKDIVPYEQALALKELGFDEPCFGFYDSLGLRVSRSPRSNGNRNSWFVESDKTNDPKISAPTFSQAFRWFRDKHKKVVCSDREGGWWIFIIKDLYDEESQGSLEVAEGDVLEDTYEQAELSCLKKLIKFKREHGFIIK